MYLLHTTVVSEMRKIRLGKADPSVSASADSVEASDLYLSVISIHELELGVLLAERRDAAQGAILRKWLDDQVLPAFDGRILDVDTVVALRSAGLHVPDPSSFRDGLIAATAFVHGMTVVTRNVDDFLASGVEILNPWTML